MTPNSAIEFLVWLLIVASVIAVVASRLRIPYTVALVIGGLVLGSLHHLPLERFTQGQRPDWLTPNFERGHGCGGFLSRCAGWRCPGLLPGIPFQQNHAETR